MAMIKTCKMPDLQTKSASGAVATFNTALAMPLSSCNVAVNAWQEGSGDPSPVNVRPIHGFSEVNATRAGKNLFDKTKIIQGKWINLDTGAIETTPPVYCISDYIFLKAGATYRIPDTATPRRWIYDLNKQPIQRVISNTTFTPTMDCYLLVTIYTVQVSIDTYQIEVGSTATAYEPYVTPTIYTIQLGQEVYGAEVDVVNGVAHCTHKFVEYSENDVLSVRPYVYNNMNGIIFRNIPDITWSPFPPGISNMSNRVGQVTRGGIWCGIGSDTRLFWIGILDILNMETVDEFKSWVADNHLQVVFELSEQDKFDIQLTPTQIETLIGNNTIFADTGDIDLTYKDLDIAKRGNFREVFKLP